MSKILKSKDGEFYIFGYNYNSSHFKSQQMTLRNQGPMTKICRDYKDKNYKTMLDITLFKLIPIKTISNSEYLEQLDSKELYNI